MMRFREAAHALCLLGMDFKIGPPEQIVFSREFGIAYRNAADPYLNCWALYMPLTDTLVYLSHAHAWDLIEGNNTTGRDYGASPFTLNEYRDEDIMAKLHYWVSFAAHGAIPGTMEKALTYTDARLQ